MCRVELVKLLHLHRYRYSVDIFFHILVLKEYWVLTESRILLKPVLGGVRIVALSISSHADSIKLSLLFSYIVGSLFLKDPFFSCCLAVAKAVVVRRGVGKTSPRT